jgi:curved DNA-binding protein CbpA
MLPESGRSVVAFPGIGHIAILLPLARRAMTKTAPSAAGTLEKSPLLHLLVSALDHGSCGTLVIETPQGARSALLFERGIPVKFRTAEPVVTLGSVLTELGWIEQSQCEKTFKEAAAAGMLHGEYLAQAGVLSADIVGRGLRVQMLRKLAWACTLPGTCVYGLYAGQDFLSRWAGDGTPMSPLRAVWQLARDMPESSAFSSLIARATSQVLRIHSEAVLEKFGFDSAECAVLDLLKVQPQPFSDLAKLNVLSVAVLQRVVYVLALTRQFDLGNGTKPMGIGLSFEHIHEVLEERRARVSRPVSIASPAAASPIEPTPSAQDPAILGSNVAAAQQSQAALEKRRQLQQLFQSYEPMDFYQLLGVERDATKDQILAAFFQLAKQYHPDKLGAELADIRDASGRFFSRLTEAQQTLSDQTMRVQYDRQLANGSSAIDSEQEQILVVVHAATSFQKAEVLFKKRMLAAAELEAKRAHESDPSQADYLALLAWIQANKPDSEQQLPQILDRLNQALRMSPESEKIHFYRGQVLARLGRQREALADYRVVVSKNPHHIEAQREIRLWEMRRKGQESAPAAGARRSSPAPGTSRRPSDPQHPARTSRTPSPTHPRTQSVTPKAGVLSRFFKR